MGQGGLWLGRAGEGGRARSGMCVCDNGRLRGKKGEGVRFNLDLLSNNAYCLPVRGNREFSCLFSAVCSVECDQCLIYDIYNMVLRAVMNSGGFGTHKKLPKLYTL